MGVSLLLSSFYVDKKLRIANESTVNNATLTTVMHLCRANQESEIAILKFIRAHKKKDLKKGKKMFKLIPFHMNTILT